MSEPTATLGGHGSAYVAVTPRDRYGWEEEGRKPPSVPSGAASTRLRDRGRARDPDRSTGGAVTVSDFDSHVWPPSSRAAAFAFRSRVAALGGTVTEPTWLGTNHPHRAICAEGHKCAPYPSGLRKGEGVCRTCAGRDPRVAEAAFRERVAALGGMVVEPAWLGSKRPHRVICIEGHECAPSPNAVQQGGGLCWTCVGGRGVAVRDPRVAEAAFYDRVAAFGGAVTEPTWLGVHRPHRAICAEGHECAPYPNSLRAGDGLCGTCAGKIWDHFYVVTDPVAQRAKVGITSGDARPRLSTHRRAGYVDVVRSFEVIDADRLERAVLATLRLAEFVPVKGREYYDLCALPAILDVVDNWEGESQ